MEAKFEDYTEQEFLDLLATGFENAISENQEAEWILHYEKITEHPQARAILFFPETDEEDSPEAVLKKLQHCVLPTVSQALRLHKT